MFKSSLYFLISDFIDQGFERSLGIVSSMHDVVAIRCIDTNEESFPDVGFLMTEDQETGDLVSIDTKQKQGTSINEFLKNRIINQDRLFNKYGIDCLKIQSDEEFIGSLIRFFRRRMRY